MFEKATLRKFVKNFELRAHFELTVFELTVSNLYNMKLLWSYLMFDEAARWFEWNIALNEIFELTVYELTVSNL